jgi:transcription-repair coupling factor (superfamily II helicase)
VVQLIKVAKIRAYAIRYGFETIQQKGQEIIMRLRPEESKWIDGQKLFQVANQFPGRVRLSSGKQIGVILKVQGLSTRMLLDLMEQFLIKYEAVPTRKGAMENVSVD